MPGIAGILSQRPDAPHRLREMLGAFSQDAGLERGEQPDIAPGVHAGWVLHRGSFVDCLPIWNETRDVALFIAGEVFTEPAQIDLLVRQGHRFTAGNASHVVHLYEEYGDGFFEFMNGSFCGLIVDLRRGVSLLFSDRYGAGRLYLHEADNGLYFASEAKALLRLFPDTRRLDPSAVAETFSFGCVIGGRTIFEGITLLPPGSSWTVHRDGRIDKRRHFDPSSLRQLDPLPDDEFYEALRDTFSSLLPRYLEGSPRPAMSLTGGLDGRMIMAWAHPTPGTMPCYSFGGTYRDCHDVRLARRIAALLGQEHRTLVAGPDMLAQFPELAARCVEASDGTMDVSGAVEVYVNRLAREISPVRITGNYGSEIVRGNVAFRPRQIDGTMLEPGLAAEIPLAETRYWSERNVSDLEFVAFKQVPWHHHARLSVEQSILTPRSPFLDNRLVELMARASPAMRTSREASLRLIHEGSPALGALPSDRGLVHGHSTPVVRLRHSLREFSARAEYAYDYGMPDWLVRVDAALSALHLEHLFLGRHKFYHFRTWYRGPLAGYLREMLLAPDARAARWFAPGALREMVEGHTGGRANHTLEIHRALTLELIERRFVDAAAYA